MLSKVFATIAVVITGGLLLFGVYDFPSFGDPNSPPNAGVEEAGKAFHSISLPIPTKTLKSPTL